MSIVPNWLVLAIQENRRDYQHKKEADFNDTKQGGKEKKNGKKIGKRHVTWPLNLLYQELFAFFRLYKLCKEASNIGGKKN